MAAVCMCVPDGDASIDHVLHRFWFNFDLMRIRMDYPTSSPDGAITQTAASLQLRLGAYFGESSKFRVILPHIKDQDIH
jgi:hypothetical protein